MGGFHSKDKSAKYVAPSEHTLLNINARNYQFAEFQSPSRIDTLTIALSSPYTINFIETILLISIV